MWQTKYASAVPKNLGLAFDFRLCSEGDFLTGRPQSVVLMYTSEIFGPAYIYDSWYIHKRLLIYTTSCDLAHVR